MKTIATLIVAMSLALLPVEAKKPKPEPPTEEIGAAFILGALVVTCAVVGVVVIIRCNSTKPDDKGPVKLILERSPDHVTWTPIATNQIVLNGLQPIEAFEDVKRNDGAFYRVQVKPPTNP